MIASIDRTDIHDFIPYKTVLQITLEAGPAKSQS